MLSRHGRHIGNGRGGGAQCDAAKAGRDDSGLVVPAHEAKHQQHAEGHGQQNLQREGCADKSQRAFEHPQLQPHQRHGEEQAQAQVGDQRQTGLHAFPVLLRTQPGFIAQQPHADGVAQHNPRHQAADKSGQLQAQMLKHGGDEVAPDQRHIEPEPGAQNAEIVHGGMGHFGGHAYVQRALVAALKLVASHQKTGNRPAHHAGGNHAHHIAGHAQLCRIGNA